jgi:hypothetical protein
MSTDVTQWNKEKFIRKMKIEAGRGLRKAATWIDREFTQSLSRPYPPKSRRGEYPRKRSGTLAGSVSVRRRGTELTIRTKAKHTRDLIKRNRKLAPSFVYENRRAIVTRILGYKPRGRQK